MKKKKILGAVLGVTLAGWLVWGNTALEVTRYPVSSSRVPEAFHGFRIVQISDLHNAEFGKENEKLLEVLAKTRPDIIVFTGDIIDSRRLDIPAAVSFVEKSAKLAPCYYVTGNHESRLSRLPELLAALEEAGATVLRNEAVMLERNGEAITLLGVDDPAFHPEYADGYPDPRFMDTVMQYAGTETAYTILLSHRPEWFELYCQSGIDLVFSGHVHGGQFRIPLIGGFFGPNQGFFPRYDAGTFTRENTTMVVSRGVGPSVIPLRINNRPEITVAELYREERNP